MSTLNEAAEVVSRLQAELAENNEQLAIALERAEEAEAETVAVRLKAIAGMERLGDIASAFAFDVGQSLAYVCNFCGEKWSLRDAAERGRSHDFECPKHPMRAVEAENAELRKATDLAMEEVTRLERDLAAANERAKKWEQDYAILMDRARSLQCIVAGVACSPGESTACGPCRARWAREPRIQAAESALQAANEREGRMREALRRAKERVERSDGRGFWWCCGERIAHHDGKGHARNCLVSAIDAALAPPEPAKAEPTCAKCGGYHTGKSCFPPGPPPPPPPGRAGVSNVPPSERPEPAKVEPPVCRCGHAQGEHFLSGTKSCCHLRCACVAFTPKAEPHPLVGTSHGGTTVAAHWVKPEGEE